MLRDCTFWGVSISDHNISYFHYFYSSVGGSGYDDASDADVGSSDEFGIILD